MNFASVYLTVYSKGCFLKDCCFFNRKKELVGKMEQPEYTKTPAGLARAPRKAKSIPAAGNSNKLYENSHSKKQDKNKVWNFKD